MIEKEIIKKKLKDFEVMEYIENVVDKPGYGFTEIQRTPLGEKIIIHTSKPGLIVGRKGGSIRELTEVLKDKFSFENPQIEVAEILNPNLNPHSVAKHIANTFQRFGPSRFKYLGYKLLEEIMKAGAVGAEIIISGRGLPSIRAKSWRFSAGHLKKSGDISENFIRRGYALAQLKSGAIGIKVIILTPDIIIPDKVEIFDKTPKAEEATEKIQPKRVIKELKRDVVKIEEKKEQIEEELKLDEKEQHIPINSNKEKIEKITKEEAEKIPSARELAKEKKKIKAKTKSVKIPATHELAKKKKVSKKNGNNQEK